MLLIVLLLLFFQVFGWCFYTTKFVQRPGDFPGVPECALAGAFLVLLIVLVLVLFCAPDCALARVYCFVLLIVLFMVLFLCS